MKLNMHTIVAIFIVLAFFGSMLAIALNPHRPQNIQEAEQPIPQQKIAQIAYSSDVNAKVYLLHNLYRLFAYTRESNISKIDRELVSKLKLKKINSYFDSIQNNPQNTSLVYVADLVLAQDSNIDNLSQIESLESTEYLMQVGKIEIPEKITITNKDLNISKEQEMEKNLVECFLLPNHKEGDAIKAKLYIIKEGDRIVSIRCVED